MPATPTAFLGGATGAAAATTTLTLNVIATVAGGTGCQIDVSFRQATGTPTPINPVITDSKGNTWTLLASGGLAAAPDYTFGANLASQLSSSGTPDTVTVTWTNACDEIVMSGVQTIGFGLTADGTVPGPSIASSSTVHQRSVTAPTGPDIVIGADVFSGGNASMYTSISNGTLIQVVGSPTNRAIASWYNVPATTNAVVTALTWSTTHSGSINGIPYIASPLGTPVANAGPDQTHAVGKLVTLAASATGSVTSYTWRIISKPSAGTATLSSTSSTAPTITPNAAGNWVFGLIAHNSTLDSAEDTMTLVAVAPSVNAGTGSTGPVGLPLPTLTAVVTGVGVTGTWAPTVGVTNPSTVTITSASSLTTTYTRPTVAGPYSFTFTGADEASTPVSATVVDTYTPATVAATGNPPEFYSAATGLWS